jgi:phenylalanyl-tRNA synthetase alpha chain
MNEIKQGKNQSFNLPSYNERGSLHLIPHVIRECKTILTKIGFEFYDCPEIESTFRCFSAANVPENHPCRDDHQSFYLDLKSPNPKEQIILRTQTTTMESYIIEKYKNNLKMFTIGRTFRRDSDSTHTPMFHQIEFVSINKDSNMTNMISDIHKFLNHFFERDLKLRTRPSHFPFTEPSIEIDMEFNGKWLEISGAGMLHPNCFTLNNTEPVTSFAGAFGIERLAMIKYNINDIRYFYDSHPKHFFHKSY